MLHQRNSRPDRLEIGHPGQVLRQQSPTFGSQLAKSTLENGVRIVTESIPGARSVSIGVVVECGSRDENPDEAGLAHLCEHLVFQGTSNRDSRELARQMDAVGGSIGAFTTHDYTCYYATVQDEYSFHALDLMGDILLNPIFPEDELEREKNCVGREIEGNLDHPMGRAQQLLMETIWPDHPLGRPVAGTMDHVRRHTRDDLIYFFHRHYVPERMIVAAAGNLEHEDFVAQARDVFWRVLGEKSLLPPRAPAFTPGFLHEVSASHQAYISIGLEAPTFANPDRYAFHVLNRVLGEGLHSRLFQKLREQSGLFYDVGSDYIAYRDAGLLRIELATEPAQQREALQAVIETVAGLASWDQPVDEDELWRAKLQLKSQYLIASEVVHTRMSRLASQEVYFASPFETGAIPDAIESVDMATLRRLAEQHLWQSLANLTAVVISPAPSARGSKQSVE